MRFTFSFVVLCALALCGVSALSFSSSLSRHDVDVSRWKANKVWFDKRVDRNHDGLISPAEYTLYVDSMDPEDSPDIDWKLLESRFKELDVNGDNLLSLAEITLNAAFGRGGKELLDKSKQRILNGNKGDEAVAKKMDLSATKLPHIHSHMVDEFEAHMLEQERQFDAVEDNARLPIQIHLALTSSPSEMRVNWMQNVTSTSTTGVVQFQPVSGGAAQTATATYSTYSVAGGLYTSLPLYTAVMTGLQPNTLYSYSVGNSVDGFSSATTFRTSPTPSTPQTQVSSKWYMVGDMGTVIPMGATVCKWMEAEQAQSPANVLLHAGDLAYAGVNSKGEWEPTWDAWMAQISPISSALPYMVTVGNHERYFNYTSYQSRFTMPSATTGGDSNLWFSWEYDGVHVTTWSTEHPVDVGTPQYNWIENDLAKAANNPDITWIILTGHRPLYSSDQSEYGTHSPGCPFLETLEPLIVKYGVSLVFTGHMHMYERSYPVINGTVINSTTPSCASSVITSQIDAHAPLSTFSQPNAPVYIVQGSAGAMIFESLVNPQPAWSDVRLQNYGYGVMSLSYTQNCASLLYQFKTQNLQVLDQMLLTKPLSAKRNSFMQQKDDEYN